MATQHLHPSMVNLTYGDMEGVPRPIFYSWEKALVIADTVWVAREHGIFRAKHSARNLRDGTSVGIAYAKGPNRKEVLNYLADQILTPGGAGPTPELLAQFPELQQAPFPLPLHTFEAYLLLCKALDLEAKNLWHEIFQHAKAQGVPWWHRMNCFGAVVGVRLSTKELWEANKTDWAPKDHAAGSACFLETEEFNFADARYLARLMIKIHLNYEYTNGALSHV